MNYHIFWGGSDVDPSFYGEPRNKRCGHSNKLRDQKEIDLAKKLIEQNKPIIGICRGAQLLNVVNKGRLLQHIEGHIGHHIIETSDGKTFTVNSTHHQMMVPTKEAEILAYDPEFTYGVNDPDDKFATIIDKVYEVLFYPKTKCFCIQFHPEAMRQNSDAVIWVKEKIKEKLGIEVDFYANQYDEYYGVI